MKVIRSRISRPQSPASAASSILKRKFPLEDHAPPISETCNFTASQLESSTTINSEISMKVEPSEVMEDGNIYNSAREESLQGEIVYKRPNAINRQSYINTHYKVSVLEVVRERLVSVGGQALLDKFVAGCFGHLMNWIPGNKCSMAVHHVLSREINMPGAKDHEMWFHINGTNLRFSYPEYALVTGLNFGPSNFSPTANHDLRNVEVYKCFCNGTKTRVSVLLERFSNTRVLIDDPDGDLYLRVAHVLVLYLFLFGFDPKKHVLPWVWKLVDDLEVFCRFPWGAYTYLILKHCMKNAMVSMPKYNFFGPVWAFHIWSLEVIPGLATVVGTLVDPAVRPRCLRWKLQGRNGLVLDPIFRLEAATRTQLVPDDDERNTFYWQSTQSPYALSVEYVEPRNSVKEGKPCSHHAPTSRVSRPIHEAPRTRRQHRQTATYDVGASNPSVAASQETRHCEACTQDSGKRLRQSVSSLRRSNSVHYRRFTDRRWMDEYTDMVVEKLDKRLMPRFEKFFEDLMDAVRCRCSHHIPSSMAPPPPPPPRTSQSPTSDDNSYESPGV